MSYYRTTQVRELVADLVDETLNEIAERILTLTDELENEKDRVADLEKELAEMEASNG